MYEMIGPIHRWLYNKILIQNGLNDAILEMAKEEGVTRDLGAEAAEAYGVLEEGQLEDIVDVTNVHGWLQARINVVESTFAFIVTELKKENDHMMNDILQVAYQYGHEHTAPAEITPKDAFRLLENELLNGMPCDHVNQMTESDDTHVEWTMATDIHQDFWTAVSGDVTDYYLIRSELIRGLMADTQLVYIEVADHTYQLKLA